MQTYRSSITLGPSTQGQLQSTRISAPQSTRSAWLPAAFLHAKYRGLEMDTPCVKPEPGPKHPSCPAQPHEQRAAPAPLCPRAGRGLDWLFLLILCVRNFSGVVLVQWNSDAEPKIAAQLPQKSVIHQMAFARGHPSACPLENPRQRLRSSLVAALYRWGSTRLGLPSRHSYTHTVFSSVLLQF